MPCERPETDRTGHMGYTVGFSGSGRRGCRSEPAMTGLHRAVVRGFDLPPANLRPEQAQGTFAGPEGEAARLAQDPANRATIVPSRCAAARTADNVRNADDAAAIELSRQPNAVRTLDLLEKPLVEIGRVEAGVDEDRTAMSRIPAAVLDVLVPVDDQPCPWLPDRQRGQERQAPAPADLRGRPFARTFHATLAGLSSWAGRKWNSTSYSKRWTTIEATLRGCCAPAAAWTLPSRRRRSIRPASTAFNSKLASMPFATSSMPKDLTRPSP